ncbi:MAG: glycosyltransferase family 8 protein [Gammaproteobacteria bacterium]|nr:glycosyltransferase family 8 protein [Gammaproteobacteria bacterium]
MKDVIHLACTSDGAYAPHTAAMLRSVFASNPGEAFRIYVLYQSLAEGDIAKLRQLAESWSANIQLLFISDDRLGNFPTQHFHKSCWYRILLPDLLPELEKILYLDSDLIVQGAVRPLWQSDISEKVFAAVTNPLYPFMPPFPRDRLHLADARSYINSGVLLMNLDRMRSTGCIARIRSYASNHPENLYPEQDALSALLHGDCLLLHPKWNAQCTLWQVSDMNLPFSPAELREARAAPVVIHFTGPYKPWSYLCRHPLRRLYWEHRRETPWPSGDIEGKTLRNIVLKPMSPTWQWRLRQLEKRLRRAAHEATARARAFVQRTPRYSRPKP